MQQKTSLKTIFYISLAGLLFSGYLSYYELFVSGGCDEAVITCGTKNLTIANLPACVYGFLMYLIIFFISLSGLKKKNQ